MGNDRLDYWGGVHEFRYGNWLKLRGEFRCGKRCEFGGVKDVVDFPGGGEL